MACLSTASWAQLRAPAASTAQSTSLRVQTSASEAEILYLALLSELQLRAGEAGAAYSLMLEAARKSDNSDIFRRAIQIALQARSGPSAIEAAQAWAQAIPASPDPHRVLVQILIGMDRLEESAQNLEKLIELTSPDDRNELLDAIGHTYARAKDSSVAATVLGAKLRPWQQEEATASSAYTALARVQAAANMKAASRASLTEALRHTPRTPAAGILSAEWLDSSGSDDEANLKRYLDLHPALHPVRLAYARYLLRQSRWADGEGQLKLLTAIQPTPLPEAWVLLGSVQMQLGRLAEAESSFKTFLAQLEAQNNPDSPEAGHARSKTQAMLSLAHIAEMGKRLTEARAWLDKIDTAEDPLRIQSLRASLLAREGKLQEGRLLLQNLPEGAHVDALAKLKAEAQLLKDNGVMDEALTVLDRASAMAPDDVDLVYERAMLLEKLGQFDAMETLLRSIIQRQPEHYNALNALGYSLADRNVRLAEAKALIEKALSLAPGDPFITDSLGWVLFRLGRPTEAIAYLRKAFDARPDVEIAVHLGEVLWTLGDKADAMHYFKRAREIQPQSDVLDATLKRLNIKP